MIFDKYRNPWIIIEMKCQIISEGYIFRRKCRYILLDIQVEFFLNRKTKGKIVYKTKSILCRAYLILLCFTDSFFQNKGLQETWIKQFYQRHLSHSICSFCISVSHFTDSCNISKALIIIEYYTCHGGNLSLVNFDDTRDLLKTQIMATFLRNKVFLN